MIVVDTNVIVALFIEGVHTRNAQRLFDADRSWSTEPFALIEFANVLSTYHRAGQLTRARTETFLAEARELLLDHFFPVDPGDALTLALDFGISVYDAHFLGVAAGRGARLVTEDAKLRRAAPRLTQSLEEALKALVH